MATPRAVGANVAFRAQFETTYGTRASGNYVTMRAYDLSGLSGERNLINDPPLGSGREPAAPVQGAFNVRGQLVVPVDKRLIGYWLKLLTGPAQSPVTLGARGHIEFSAVPSNNQTIVLNGVTWTFVTSGATGPQTNISAGDLQATIDQLVIDLNGSADADIDDATYTRLGNRLVISHDTATSAGNSYTLSAGTTTGVVSAATLYGGGLISHEFRSGAATLPSLTTELHHPELSTNPYTITDGVMANTMTIRREREGLARATVDFIGRRAADEAASVAGTPTTPTFSPFSQFQGGLLVDDVQVANIASAEISYSNGMLIAENLTDDGYIEGGDPGQIAVTLNIVARYSNNALKAAVDAGSTVTVRFSYLDKVTGEQLSFYFNELHLPVPNRQVNGPGYIDVSYEAVGAVGGTRSMTTTLINDVAAYT